MKTFVLVFRVVLSNGKYGYFDVDIEHHSQTHATLTGLRHEKFSLIKCKLLEVFELV